SDQSVELVAQATGYCYVRVDSNSSSGGVFTVTTHSEQTFPRLSLGQASPNQELKWAGDMKLYQVPVQAGQKVFALIDKNSGFYTSLLIKEGGLPGSASSVSYGDQAVELIAQATGYCYVRVESGSSSGGTFTITAYDERTFPSLSLGQSSPTQELKWAGDVKWYQVPVQAGQKIFVLLDKNSRFYTSLSIKEGELPGQANSNSDRDQAVELRAQMTGYCYVRVESYLSSVGAFTITIYDEQTFPTLTLGQSQPNQELKWAGDVRWYRVLVRAGQKIFALLDKNSGGFYTSLSIKESGLPDVGDNQSSDQSVELVAQATGYCYVRVDSNSSSGGVFTVTAHSDQTFPMLMTGQVLANQRLAWAGDKRWYQFKQGYLGPLVVRLVKSGSWYATLRVRKGSLPTGAVSA
ncbi:MAG: hypothetical protein MN733_29670, partial [Nitrososphaera sp.]|nr:hypothetical protein [Nitrososphaera sp.]